MGNKGSTPAEGDEAEIPTVPAATTTPPSTDAVPPPPLPAEKKAGLAKLLTPADLLKRGGEGDRPVQPTSRSSGAEEGSTKANKGEKKGKKQMEEGKEKEAARETLLSMLGRASAAASEAQPPPRPTPSQQAPPPPASKPVAPAASKGIKAISISELEARVGGGRPVEGGKGIGRGEVGAGGGNEERGKALISMLSQANKTGSNKATVAQPSTPPSAGVVRRDHSKEAALKGMLFGGGGGGGGGGGEVEQAIGGVVRTGGGEGGNGNNSKSSRRRKGGKDHGNRQGGGGGGGGGKNSGVAPPPPQAATAAAVAAAPPSTFAWSSFQRSPDPKTIPMPPAVFKGPGLALGEEGEEEGREGGGAGIRTVVEVQDATKDLKNLLKLG